MRIRGLQTIWACKMLHKGTMLAIPASRGCQSQTIAESRTNTTFDIKSKKVHLDESETFQLIFLKESAGVAEFELSSLWNSLQSGTKRPQQAHFSSSLFCPSCFPSLSTSPSVHDRFFPPESGLSCFVSTFSSPPVSHCFCSRSERGTKKGSLFFPYFRSSTSLGVEIEKEGRRSFSIRESQEGRENRGKRTRKNACSTCSRSQRWIRMIAQVIVYAEPFHCPCPCENQNDLPHATSEQGDGNELISSLKVVN